MWLKCVLFQRVYFELKRRVRIQTQIRAIWLVKIKASLWGGEGGAFVLKGLHRIEKTEFLSLIDLFGPPVWVQGFLKCKEAIVLTLFFAVDFSSNKILELDQTLWKSLLIFPHYIFLSFPRVIFRYISFRWCLETRPALVFCIFLASRQNQAFPFFFSLQPMEDLRAGTGFWWLSGEYSFCLDTWSPGVCTCTRMSWVVNLV